MVLQVSKNKEQRLRFGFVRHQNAKMDDEVLEAVKKSNLKFPMVMISGHGDMETAINTMRLGAFDYISKPPDLKIVEYGSCLLTKTTS
jgi:DNA-binding NtrC family response regulator